MMSWLGAMMLAEFGVAQTLTRQISFSNSETANSAIFKDSKFSHDKGREAQMRFFHSSRIIYAGIALLLVMVIVSAAQSGAVFSSVELKDDFVPVWYLLAGSVIFVLWAKPYQSVLEGHQLLSWQHLSIFVPTILSKIFLVLVLFWGQPIWYAAATFCFGSVFQFILSKYFCHKLKLISPLKGHVRLADKKRSGC